MINWWKRYFGRESPPPVQPAVFPSPPDPATFACRVLRETNNYVVVAPANRNTTHGQILYELEFFLEQGYRPLCPLYGPLEGWICEKLSEIKEVRSDEAAASDPDFHL